MTQPKLARLLEGAYAGVVGWDSTPLRTALAEAGDGPALFVGTGGTLAVAHLAAQLHEENTGNLGRVVTPLELLELPPLSRVGAVLFSAGLKHPDALASLDALTTRQFGPSAVVTLRPANDLPPAAAAVSHAVSLPGLEGKEGFLATGSVLTMMAALIKAWDHGRELPDEVPWPVVELPGTFDRLLTVHMPRHSPVSIDMETRFHELGLAPVQVTDYRNLAHGRHVGLSRRAETTAVIAMTDANDDTQSLARTTLEILRAGEVEVFEWPARLPGHAGALELAIASMQFADCVAESQRVNTTRPGAPSFGRRLYHLKMSKFTRPAVNEPVERKLRSQTAYSGVEAKRVYREAHSRWISTLEKARFRSLVLDYDGTVCSTMRRTDLPSDSLRQELCRLMDAGIPVGLASGRGPSLYRDLRAWLPSNYWESVFVGMYNGGALYRLDEDVDDLREPNELMSAVADRLSTTPALNGLLIEPRAVQVTVSPAQGVEWKADEVVRAVQDAIESRKPLPVKAHASGHSVDVVPETSSKTTVVDLLERVAAGEVLAIGDQGHVGGNDYDLLHRSPFSLSVDTCSDALDRCWFMGHRSQFGPKLLWTYLRGMEASAGEFSFALGSH